MTDATNGAVDAALISLCARFISTERALRSRFATYATIPADAWPAEHLATLAQVAAMPAATIAGVLAKARAVHAYLQPDAPDPHTPAGQAIWSLLRDAAALGGCRHG